MSERETTGSSRALIGAVLAVFIVGALFAADPEGAVVAVECAAQGRMAMHSDVPEGPFTTDYVGYEFRGDAHNLIDWHVYVFGAWEPEVVAAMKDLLVLYRGDDGVVVDVGANIGTHSLYVADVAKTVHAIEPWPPVLERLDEMLMTNKVENVVVHPVGFAEEPGEMEYNVPPDENLGKGTFSTDVAESTGFADEPEVMLPLVVGDDYLAEKGVNRVDLIKMDIEGYEKMAFRGLSEVMRRDRPIVLFELHVDNNEGFHSMEELRETFPADYLFFDLSGRPLKIWRFGDRMVTCGNPEGIYVIKPFIPHFENRSGNVLALPAELAPRLKELPSRAHVHLHR